VHGEGENVLSRGDDVLRRVLALWIARVRGREVEASEAGGKLVVENRRGVEVGRSSRSARRVPGMKDGHGCAGSVDETSRLGGGGGFLGCPGGIRVRASRKSCRGVLGVYGVFSSVS